jgi:hypothetical protein
LAIDAENDLAESHPQDAWRLDADGDLDARLQAVWNGFLTAMAGRILPFDTEAAVASKKVSRQP